MKDKIKYKFQRAKKGYCDNDVYSIYDWFLEIFPKMLREFAEKTISYPSDADKLREEVSKMPVLWLESQRETINNIFKKHKSYSEYDLDNSMCCWLLIILRTAYCFEMCNKWREKWDNLAIKLKEEGFYLFEKWFFDLWW